MIPDSLSALSRLIDTVRARRGASPENSYSARLLAEGVGLCAKKFGEESVETIIAALQNDKQAVVRESADLLYHWVVLLEAADVSVENVMTELDRRTGQSGLEEKAARGRTQPE